MWFWQSYYCISRIEHFFCWGLDIIEKFKTKVHRFTWDRPFFTFFEASVFAKRSWQPWMCFKFWPFWYANTQVFYLTDSILRSQFFNEKTGANESINEGQSVRFLRNYYCDRDYNVTQDVHMMKCVIQKPNMIWTEFLAQGIPFLNFSWKALSAFEGFESNPYLFRERYACFLKLYIFLSYIVLNFLYNSELCFACKNTCEERYKYFQDFKSFMIIIIKSNFKLFHLRLGFLETRSEIYLQGQFSS